MEEGKGKEVEEKEKEGRERGREGKHGFR